MLDAPPRKIPAMSLLQSNSNVATVNPTKRAAPEASNSSKSQTFLSTKPVPMATVRSSKLAAMAANMKNTHEIDVDLDTDDFPETEQTGSKDDSLIKLENIMIVPDIVSEDCNNEIEENAGYSIPSNVSSMSSTSTTHSSPEGAGDNSLDVSEVGNGSFGSFDFNPNDSTTTNQEKSSANTTPADTRQNMSLSCVNPNGVQETNYRLDSM